MSWLPEEFVPARVEPPFVIDVENGIDVWFDLIPIEDKREEGESE